MTPEELASLLEPDNWLEIPVQGDFTFDEEAEARDHAEEINFARMGY